jgi:hypothetical protein
MINKTRLAKFGPANFNSLTAKHLAHLVLLLIGRTISY